MMLTADSNNDPNEPPTYLDLYVSHANEQKQKPKCKQKRARYKLNPFPHFRGWWRDTKWTDKTIAIFTIVIAGAAVLQWREMSSTGLQTDRIIKADERIATAMENSVKEANDALTATQESMRLDQRAWVGPSDSPPPRDLRVGGKPTFSVIIFNTGKTPALHMKESVIWTPAFAGEPFKPIYGKNAPQRSASALFPNHGVIASSRGQSILTQANIDDLKAGKYIIWFYGSISYDDTFAKPHHTFFCFFYTGEDFTAPKTCATYNDAD
jgi:hypothetical protein